MCPYGEDVFRLKLPVCKSVQHILSNLTCDHIKLVTAPLFSSESFLLGQVERRLKQHLARSFQH